MIRLRQAAPTLFTIITSTYEAVKPYFITAYEIVKPHFYNAYELTKPNIPTIFSLLVSTRHTAITPALDNKTRSLEKDSTLTVGVHEEDSLYNNKIYTFLTDPVNLRYAVAAFLSQSLYYNVRTNKNPTTQLKTLLRSAPITLFFISTAAAIILEKEKEEYYKQIENSKNSPDTKIEEGINLVRDEEIRDHSVWGIAWIEATAVTISTFTSALLAVQTAYEEANGSANNIGQAQQGFTKGLTNLVTTLTTPQTEQPVGSPIRELPLEVFTFIVEAAKATNDGLQPTVDNLEITKKTIKNSWSITLPMAVGLLSSMVQFLKTNSLENMHIAKENNLTLKGRKELREIMAKFDPIEALEKLSEFYNCDASFGNAKPTNVDAMLIEIFARKCKYLGTINRFSSVKAYSNAAFVVIQEFVNDNIVNFIYSTISTIKAVGLKLIPKFISDFTAKYTSYTQDVLANINATSNEKHTGENGEDPLVIQPQDGQQPKVVDEAVIDVFATIVQKPFTDFILINPNANMTVTEPQDQVEQQLDLNHDAAIERILEASGLTEEVFYNLAGAETNNDNCYLE